MREAAFIALFGAVVGVSAALANFFLETLVTQNMLHDSRLSELECEARHRWPEFQPGRAPSLSEPSPQPQSSR